MTALDRTRLIGPLGLQGAPANAGAPCKIKTGSVEGTPKKGEAFFWGEEEKSNVMIKIQTTGKDNLDNGKKRRRKNEYKKRKCHEQSSLFPWGLQGRKRETADTEPNTFHVNHKALCGGCQTIFGEKYVETARGAKLAPRAVVFFILFTFRSGSYPSFRGEWGDPSFRATWGRGRPKCRPCAVLHVSVSRRSARQVRGWWCAP